MIIIEVLLSLWLLFLLLVVVAKAVAAFVLCLGEFLHWVHIPFRKLATFLVGDDTDQTMNARVICGYLLYKLIVVGVYVFAAHMLGASGTVTFWTGVCAFLFVG